MKFITLQNKLTDEKMEFDPVHSTWIRNAIRIAAPILAIQIAKFQSLAGRTIELNMTEWEDVKDWLKARNFSI